jgi:hypothetical protein
MTAKNIIEESSIEWQLGYYVGEYIINTYLPTLSTNTLKTNRVIEVSEDETRKLEELEEVYCLNSFTIKGTSSGEAEKESWAAYLKYSQSLTKKYLPPTIKCYLPFIPVEVTERFKKGVCYALWDCDMCSYSTSTKDLKTGKENGATFIELTLDQLVHPEDVNLN